MDLKKLLEEQAGLSAQNLAFVQPVMPEITMPHLPDSTRNPAKWTYTRLVEYIKDFEAELDDDHEIGARLVSFGQAITFHIQDIGYYGPDIISFYGTNDQGEKLQLIQHISQLSVLLIGMKKQNEAPRRIGFILNEKTKDE
ncbi:DUF6173 family protein [Aeromonas veronii]